MSNNDATILIVEDESAVRGILSVSLSRKYHCITAENAEDAMHVLASSPVDLVLADIHLPGASGINLCQAVRMQYPDTVVVMVTGEGNIDYAIQASREGAFDYIRKPFTISSLIQSVERALGHQALMAARRDYEKSLKESLEVRTFELRSLNQDLNQIIESLYNNYRATLRAMAKALEARDIETAGHSDRVVAYALRLGKEMGLTPNELIALEQGALLHDIGKVRIRESILLKPGPLNEDEWAEMRAHVDSGLKIIQDIEVLSGARPVIVQHHEKFDGTGYPGGLRGESIHLNARIFAVGDAFDSMTSDHLYRPTRGYHEARDEIVEASGTHFDPQVVEAFLRVGPVEWSSIRATAGQDDFLHHIIENREIRSFIVSLKHQRGSTGPLTTTSSLIPS
jgi:response regulator RpfG family c-di-GMP phosphodiesterase